MLVNGEPGEEIIHQRDLCQGNPLSPMIFIFSNGQEKEEGLFGRVNNSIMVAIVWFHGKGFKDLSGTVGWASMISLMCWVLRIG